MREKMAQLEGHFFEKERKILTFPLLLLLFVAFASSSLVYLPHIHILYIFKRKETI